MEIVNRPVNSQAISIPPPISKPPMENTLPTSVASRLEAGGFKREIAGRDFDRIAKAAEAAGKIQDTTQLAWLIGTAERVLAILCHMSSRTLVLLGVTKRRIGMVVGGFVLFTYIDSVAGAAHISGNIGKFSLWWIELAIVPAALASLVILHWCWRTWGKPEPAPSAPAAHADEHTPNDVHGENA